MELNDMDLDYMLMIYTEHKEAAEKFTELRGVFLAKAWNELNNFLTLLNSFSDETIMTYSEVIYEYPELMSIIVGKATNQMKKYKLVYEG